MKEEKTFFSEKRKMSTPVQPIVMPDAEEDPRFPQYLEHAARAKAGQPEQLLDVVESISVLLKSIGDYAESEGDLRLAVACQMVAQLALIVGAVASVNGTAQPVDA